PMRSGLFTSRSVVVALVRSLPGRGAFAMLLGTEGRQKRGVEMGRRILLVLAAAALFTLGVGQAQGHSNPTAVEDLAGHWRGFFDSSAPGEIGTSTLDMPESHNRQLDGVLGSPTLPMSLPFHVTVGASDVFNAVSPGGNFVVH